jgi:hypothetical protein
MIWFSFAAGDIKIKPIARQGIRASRPGNKELSVSNRAEASNIIIPTKLKIGAFFLIIVSSSTLDRAKITPIKNSGDRANLILTIAYTEIHRKGLIN